MVLGYNLLQIPNFILFIITRTKRWFSQIQYRKDQGHTTALSVSINEREPTSKGKLEKEMNEVCNRKGAICCADSKYEKITKIIEQLEKSMDSKFEEIIKRMERLENSTFGAFKQDGLA